MSNQRVAQLEWAVKYLEYFTDTIKVLDMMVEGEAEKNKRNISEIKALKSFNERIAFEVAGNLKIYRTLLDREKGGKE